MCSERHVSYEFCCADVSDQRPFSAYLTLLKKVRLRYGSLKPRGCEGDVHERDWLKCIVPELQVDGGAIVLQRDGQLA